MDFSIWEALLGIVSWSIRLLFWPLGVVTKYWEIFGTVLPYLALGVVGLFIGTVALGLLGAVLHAVFVIVRGIYRLFAAIVSVFRPSDKDESQGADEVNAQPISDPDDPYQVLGVSRDVTEKELTARYRQLLRVNHPDKVAQLDPEIQAFASERSRIIIGAYEQIRFKSE